MGSMDFTELRLRSSQAEFQNSRFFSAQSRRRREAHRAPPPQRTVLRMPLRTHGFIDALPAQPSKAARNWGKSSTKCQLCFVFSYNPAGTVYKSSLREFLFNTMTAPPTEMFLVLFRSTGYALFAFAAVAFLVILRRRFRQRHLWNIPGPSNASLVWGNILVSEMIRTVY